MIIIVSIITETFNNEHLLDLDDWALGLAYVL